MDHWVRRFIDTRERSGANGQTDSIAVAIVQSGSLQFTSVHFKILSKRSGKPIWSPPIPEFWPGVALEIVPVLARLRMTLYRPFTTD